jgi:hypothetical protein
VHSGLQADPFADDDYAAPKVHAAQIPLKLSIRPKASYATANDPGAQRFVVFILSRVFHSRPLGFPVRLMQPSGC